MVLKRDKNRNNFLVRILKKEKQMAVERDSKINK